jgi:hypothetical protein
MSQARRRQVARFEQRAERYSEAIRLAKAHIDAQPLPLEAVVHAINIGLLVLGNPKIDEPLSMAWIRAMERCSEKVSGIPEFTDSFSPFDKIGARFVAVSFLGRVPGLDEREKFTATFAAAPPWLIYFTYGDYTADLLRITVPDLSSMAKFMRSEETLKRWPALPVGPFERRPRPEGAVDPRYEPLTPSERELVRNEMLCLDEKSTPRQRKRALDIYLKYSGAKK